MNYPTTLFLICCFVSACGGGTQTSPQTDSQILNSGFTTGNPFLSKHGAIYTFELEDNPLKITCDNSDETFERNIPDFSMEVSITGASASLRPVINSPYLEPVRLSYTTTTGGFSTRDSESNPPDLVSFSTIYEELNGVVQGSDLNGYFSIGGRANLPGGFVDCYGDIPFTATIVPTEVQEEEQQQVDGTYSLTAISTIPSNGSTACLGGAGTLTVGSGNVTGLLVSDWGYAVSLGGTVTPEGRVASGSGTGGGAQFFWSGDLQAREGSWSDSTGCRGTWAATKIN